MKRLPLLGAAALGLLSVCASASADGYRSSRYDDRYGRDHGFWRYRDRDENRYDRGRYEGRYDRDRYGRPEARHSYRVLYRSNCGTTSWREYGCYDCRESAERAARCLDRDRYLTRIECH